MERDARLQGIFTYLFIPKALRRERPSLFPKGGAPMETLTAGKSKSNFTQIEQYKWKVRVGGGGHLRAHGFHCTSVYTTH
jgi:hypothetical protein